jgi:hypothetical protein
MPRMTSAELAAHEARMQAMSSARRGMVARTVDAHDGPESELHDYVLSRCRTLGWYVVHSRMDRRTTCIVGQTDCIIAVPGGRTLWLELKTRTGKLRPEQAAAQAWLLKLGHRHAVCRSPAEIEAALRGAMEP